MAFEDDIVLAGVTPEAPAVVAWEDWLARFDRTGEPPPPLPRPSRAWDLDRVVEGWVASTARHRDIARPDWRRILGESGFMGGALHQQGAWPPGVVLRSPAGPSLEWLAGWLDTLGPDSPPCTGSRWPGRSGPDGPAAWGFDLLSGWWDAARGRVGAAPAQAWMSACDALAGLLGRLGLDDALPWGAAWVAEYRQNQVVAALMEGDPCPGLPPDHPAARRLGGSVLWTGTVEALIVLAPVFVRRWWQEGDFARLDAWGSTLARASRERPLEMQLAAIDQSVYWSRWSYITTVPEALPPEKMPLTQAAALGAIRDSWKMAVSIPLASVPSRPRQRL